MKRILLVGLLMLLMMGQAWGASDTIWWAEYPYKQRVNLSGTGSDETNYVVPLNVHFGTLTGTATKMDIYCGGLCRSDFSDIRFSDATGAELNYQIISSGNYELIPDDGNVGISGNVIAADGTLIAGNVAGRSANLWLYNGSAWKEIYGQAAVPLLISTNGYVYANYNHIVIRALLSDLQTCTAGAGAGQCDTKWATSLDLTADVADVLPFSAAEDESGNIWMHTQKLQSNVGHDVFKSGCAFDFG